MLIYAWDDFRRTARSAAECKECISSKIEQGYASGAGGAEYNIMHSLVNPCGRLDTFKQPMPQAPAGLNARIWQELSIYKQ